MKEKQTKTCRDCETEVKGRAKLCQECKDKIKEKSEKPHYSFESKLRCTAFKKTYPAFMGVRCNTLMNADGTINGGSQKNWQCPMCGRKTRTDGKLI